MWWESIAMVTTMLRLMREHQVPSLTVHDSLIVPLSKQALAEGLLSHQYFWVCQERPFLTVKTPSLIVNNK
jgi:hypothetical protein